MRTWSSGYTFNWFSPYGKQVVVKSCTFQFLQLCYDDKNSPIFYLSKNDMTTFPAVATLLCETIFKKPFDPNYEQISELWSNTLLPLLPLIMFPTTSYRHKEYSMVFGIWEKRSSKCFLTISWTQFSYIFVFNYIVPTFWNLCFALFLPILIDLTKTATT